MMQTELHLQMVKKNNILKRQSQMLLDKVGSNFEVVDLKEIVENEECEENEQVEYYSRTISGMFLWITIECCYTVIFIGMETT